MFDKLSENYIWVSANAPVGGDGSADKPFSRIKDALDCAVSGSVVALTSGNYEEKLVVRDLCGTIEEPITILAFDENGKDAISYSDWYFYSTKDIIVKGVVFSKTQNAAISIIGEAERCSIKDCKFIECGEVSECTIFFGGSGGQDCVVENCEFSAPKDAENHIAIMISQSTDENEEKFVSNSKNSSVRFCRFKNCKTAVVVGSDENICGLFGGHEIYSCLFENCKTGIKIKVSGTQIGRNIFRNTNAAIITDAGGENEIFENRFENCPNAMIIGSDDATISENCFIDSKISFDGDEENKNAVPILIHKNTFISNTEDEEIISARCKSAAFANKNIFYNCGINKQYINEEGSIFEKNNIFADLSNGDFSTDLDYGCKSGAQKLLEIGEIPKVDIVELFKQQEKELMASDHENASTKQELLSQNIMDERDLFIKAMCFQNDDENDEDEIEFEASHVGYEGLRPIGIDGELEDN
ncbi:MAG: hypothetical protein FWE23_03100 [Chitinivibrionia bacterium]|nr:hypothetical protein [Chitinivibrionia bacterium]